MTSVPGPEPKPTAGQIIAPLRELAALVLVGANALLLFAALIDLLIPAEGGPGFGNRAARGFFDLVGLTAILLPLLAVLLATIPQPPVGRAKLITQAAVVEYAVSAVFAVLSFLVWMVYSLADLAFRGLFTGLLDRVAFLALFGVAAYAVYRIWRTLYYVPRPKREPGVYGRPQPTPYGQPQPGWAQPGQPTPYGQPPSPYGPVGQPNPYGQPPSPYGQPTAGAGPAYGEPPMPPFGASSEATQVVGQSTPQSAPPAPPLPPSLSPPPFIAPPPPGSAPVSAAPASAPPASAPPASAPPASAPPASAPPAATLPETPAPASAPPASASESAAPASAPPSPRRPTSADPAATTQVVPPAGDDDSGTERTQVIPRPAGPDRSTASGPSQPAAESGAEPTQVIPRPAARPDASEQTQMIIPSDRGVRRPEDGSDQR